MPFSMAGCPAAGYRVDGLLEPREGDLLPFFEKQFTSKRFHSSKGRLGERDVLFPFLCACSVVFGVFVGFSKKIHYRNTEFHRVLQRFRIATLAESSKGILARRRGDPNP